MENRREKDSDIKRQEPVKNLSPVIDGQEYRPQCGRPLQARKCKHTCDCSYFMSCSDF
jgi:hypothetical protein